MTTNVLLAALPAFLASFVEFVEALTIVLAVGAAAGWREALWGASAGIVTLVLLVAGFGRSLAAIPERLLEGVIGTLLVLFGLRWLRKAALRAAGIIPIHDEARAFERTRDSLRRRRHLATLDWGAAATSYNAVLLEGIEVLFIVLALGGGTRALRPAATGAGLAFCAVLLLGVIVHRPLLRVPENALKMLVGIMLCAFGTLWAAEAAGAQWPSGDFAVLWLIAGFALSALVATSLARRRASSAA